MHKMNNLYGLEVPTATPYVHFTTNALGTVVGTVNGDLKVYAEADGLRMAVLNIEV